MRSTTFRKSCAAPLRRRYDDQCCPIPGPRPTAGAGLGDELRSLELELARAQIARIRSEQRQGEAFAAWYWFKKMLWVVIALWLLTTFASVAQAAPAPMLVVVIQEFNGEKSIHYQKVPDCLFLLKTYRQATKEDVPFNLTLVEPDVTGRVLGLSCVHPDGSIEGDYARPAAQAEVRKFQRSMADLQETDWNYDFRRCLVGRNVGDYYFRFSSTNPVEFDIMKKDDLSPVDFKVGLIKIGSASFAAVSDFSGYKQLGMMAAVLPHLRRGKMLIVYPNDHDQPVLQWRIKDGNKAANFLVNCKHYQ